MKRFFENTLISGAYSKALRVIALLCVLLGFSATALGATLPGSFNGWTADGSTVIDNGYTVNLTAGNTYEFKIESGGTWYGNNGEIKGDISGWVFYSSDGNGNCKITASISGNYTFTLDGWQDGNPKLKVTYPTASTTNEIGFWDEEAWNIKVGDNWMTEKGYGATGNVVGIDLGTITSGTKIGFWAHTYQKGNVNVCSPRVYIKYEKKDGTEITGYQYKEVPFSQTESETNGSTNKLFLGEELETIPALEPGQYTMKVYFEMWGDKESSTEGSCKQYKDILLNNGGGNYVFTFTISESGSGGEGGEDAEGCTTVYLNNELNLWDTSNYYTYIYYWGSSVNTSWKAMTPSSNCSKIWYGSIPNDASGYKFVLLKAVYGTPKFDDKLRETGDLSLSNQHQYKITSNVQGQTSSNGEYQTPTCTDKDPNCSGPGGGGGDTPSDPTISGCDYIEIWCRYEDGNTDMRCYAWDASENKLLGDYPGCLASKTEKHDGKDYAVWVIPNVDNINIIFNDNNNQNNQTADITGLLKGNRYFYTLNSSTCNYVPTSEKLACSLDPTDVLLSREAYIDPATKIATVYGYLKATNCEDITDYGFYFCTTVDGATPCIPVANDELKWSAIGSGAGTTPLPRGMEFSAYTSALDAGFTYYYRAYAVVGDETILSQEVRSLTTEPCVAQTCCGDPIIYTVDARFTTDNTCKLYFRDVQKAINHLKGSYASDPEHRYVTIVDGSYNLNQPVVINVRYYDDNPTDNTSAYLYRGTTSVGFRAGDAQPVNSNLISDINKNAENRANTLTIKAGTTDAKPWVHHIVIRNSRNIVLDSLCIYSDTNGVGDNAIEMDINHADKSDRWNELNTKGYLTDANITVKNCIIHSDGFTGAHISSYDGITFKNNDFEVIAGDKTDPYYGASFKLMYCKNVKFIENNFRGDHATLMWIQEVENMLVMNNVFWNTNRYTVKDNNSQFPAAMRLVTQWNPIKNVGFFYNTYYLDSNEVTATNSGYDFLQMTHTVSGGTGDIDVSTIQFKYNNCYSYDADAPGRTPDDKNYMYYKDGEVVADYTGPFLSLTLPEDNFCGNNFWSEYDDIKKNKKSAFAFGCSGNNFINVKGEVCETTAAGPASLIIKGNSLNLGSQPNVDFTGIKLEAEETLADRYLVGVRPNGKGWTYGAYQTREAKDVDKIFWIGISDNWDDRSNWEFEVKNNDKVVRQTVSCVENLSENLHVVIEEKATIEIDGGRKWPRIPDTFDANSRKTENGIPVLEQVNAGNTGKFASYIELQYGAGITGVENLVNGSLHYDAASTKFVSPRSEWILVGPTIKPWNEDTAESDDVREVLSGDYFIANQEPHVYMHQAQVVNTDDGPVVSWDPTFADLKTSLTHDKAFAMQIPDEYGPFKLPAELHFGFISPNEDMLADGTKEKDYTFEGRFYNESALPTYTGLTAGKSIMLSNTYPANIDAAKLDNSGLGRVQVYDYVDKSFKSLTSRATTPILSQHGFVFTPAKSENLVITKDYFLNTITKRAAEIVDPYCRIRVQNMTSNTASEVEVEIDELKEDVANYGTDAPKVFNAMEESLPDMYIMRYDKKWADLTIPSMTESIPLGVRINKAGSTIRFSFVESEGLGDIYLEDRLTGEIYNLTIGQVCTVSDLPVGDCEGRFFLNISEDVEDEEDNTEEGGDVSTEVEEEIFTDSGISIIGNSEGVVVSCSTDMELQYIYINDMSGKTAMYKVSGNYVAISLPVAQGVYTVNVIADKANKTGKVILK